MRIIRQAGNVGTEAGRVYVEIDLGGMMGCGRGWEQ